VLGKGAAVIEVVAAHEEDMLKPPREVLEQVVELSQQLKGYEL
jgi:hypothetical protein